MNWVDCCRCVQPYAVALLLLTSGAHAGQGDESAFFQHKSQHAYNAVFGLPAVASRPAETHEWQLSLEHSNQFMGGSSGDEVLLLDGESTELGFRYKQRISACWQAEALIPFIAHNGGEFDRAIDDWHRFFGLPDASRGDAPYSRLSYSYENLQGKQHDISSPQSGLGDVQLSLQRSLACSPDARSEYARSIVRLGIKLPTGSAEELSGSGESDLYLDIQTPVYSNGGRWRTAAAIGALYVGKSEKFARQKQWVAYGSLGAQFVYSHRWRALTQLDWHTPFYVSALRELGDPAISLTVGIRYLTAGDQTVELSISEDIEIDTTPDIVARLAWTYRPRAGR